MSEWVLIVFFVAVGGNPTIATVDFSSKELCEAAIPAVVQAGSAIIGGGVGRSTAFCVERNKPTVRKKLRELKPKA